MAIDTTSTGTTPDAAPTTSAGRLGIGMVGYAFMGVAHSQGWRNARSFFDPQLVPDLVAISGRDGEAAARSVLPLSLERGLEVRRLPAGGVRVSVRVPLLLDGWDAPVRLSAVSALGTRR